MDRPQWVVVGRRLGAVSRSNQWWLGDWLRYGTAKWGDKYVEAAKITGYDVRSLANMASLAGSFEMSRRRDNLTWSHHAVVAALDPDEQDRWLDMAAAERLSVADLRIELRSVERQCGAKERACADPAEDEVSVFICPRCGYRPLEGGAGAGSAPIEKPANADELVASCMCAPSLSPAAAASPLCRLSVSRDERGLAIRATGHVDLTNPYMSGHFPSFQVYPGMFHLENVAYAVAAARADAGLGPLRLAEIRSMRFRAPLFAEDTFEVEATVLGTGGGSYDVDASCRQANGAVCARVKLVMQGTASLDA